jgi:hypothetical protein
LPHLPIVTRIEENTMIATGIAHPAARLGQPLAAPTIDLVTFAAIVLREYRPTHFITSLFPGWEHALTLACIELDIPFTLVIPSLDRRLEKGAVLPAYQHAAARATCIQHLPAGHSGDAREWGLLWRIDRADTIFTLWDYEFHGEIFRMLGQALRLRKSVVNLWEPWRSLADLRKLRTPLFAPPKMGAQVFEARKLENKH